MPAGQRILSSPTHKCTKVQPEGATVASSRTPAGPALANRGRGRENAPDMAFDDELGLLGFRLAQEKRDGTRTFSLARNRYLTYWLHLPADDTVALFTWEFALGEYMNEYGLQVGANEPLNQYLFPQVDTEVAQDMADIAKAMERTEAMFAGMDFGHRG